MPGAGLGAGDTQPLPPKGIVRRAKVSIPNSPHRKCQGEAQNSTEEMPSSDLLLGEGCPEEASSLEIYASMKEDNNSNQGSCLTDRKSKSSEAQDFLSALGPSMSP